MNLAALENFRPCRNAQRPLKITSSMGYNRFPDAGPLAVEGQTLEGAQLKGPSGYRDGLVCMQETLWC